MPRCLELLSNLPGDLLDPIPIVTISETTIPPSVLTAKCCQHADSLGLLDVRLACLPDGSFNEVIPLCCKLVYAPGCVRRGGSFRTETAATNALCMSLPPGYFDAKGKVKREMYTQRINSSKYNITFLPRNFLEQPYFSSFTSKSFEPTLNMSHDQC
jgi:hypothetical protein